MTSATLNTELVAGHLRLATNLCAKHDLESGELSGPSNEHDAHQGAGADTLSLSAAILKSLSDAHPRRKFTAVHKRAVHPEMGSMEKQVMSKEGVRCALRRFRAEMDTTKRPAAQTLTPPK